MSRLLNHRWSDFYLKEYFDFKKGNQNNMSSLTDGDIPLVSARNTDNGYKAFVSNNDKDLFQGEILTLNNDGDGGAGIAYYQPCVMSLDSHVTALYPKVQLTRYQLLFIAMCITKQRGRFGHGYSINASRLHTFRIMLPCKVNTITPDWEFMEQFMIEIERNLLSPAIEKLRKQMTSDMLKSVNGGGKIGIVWKNYTVHELFPKLSSGKSKGLNHIPLDRQGVNYLGATNLNNGVLCSVKPIKSMIQKGNCIAFIRNGDGSVGYSVYKQEDFIATSDISIGYNENLNIYTGTFITTIADRVRGKYNHGYKRNPNRLSKEILTLPAKDDGSPDWQYMENYMRMVECQHLSTYLDFIKKRGL